MRIYSADALAALDSGRFTVRCLLKVELPESEIFAIWDDVGTIIVGGVTYTGAASRFTVKPAAATYDSGARPCIVTLSGLDSETAAIVDGAQWHQRPILIQRAVIATDAPAVLHLADEFSGRLDQMVLKEQVGSTYTIDFLCESEAIENQRSGARTRSDADQRERDATDGFFSFSASAVTTTIDWGRAPQQAAQRKGGIAGFLGKIF